MKRFFFLLTIFFVCVFVAFSQNKASSEISVRFLDAPASDSITMYPLKTIINQTIDFKDYPNDTVRLDLEYAFVLPVTQFFFPSLTVTAFYNGNREVLKYDLNAKGITFLLPSKTCKISIDYEYQSDEFFRGSFEGIAYYVPYLYSWCSWFFVSDDIHIKRVKINVPESRDCFVNLPYEKSGNQIIIDAEKAKENEISFYILTKEFYDHYSFKHKSVDVDVYQTSGSVFVPDKQIFIPKEMDAKLVKERNKIARKAVSKIWRMFKEDNPMKISIAEKCLRKGFKIASGYAFAPYQDENSILIDSSFWYNSSLYHELVHCFYNKAIDYMQFPDTAYYFLGESMVEYIANYLKYDTFKERDKAFSDRMLNFAQSKEKGSSIFKLTDNKIDGDQSGSSYIVYYKTPFVIHNFAKEVGEKRFIRIIKDFYREGMEKKVVTMALFESVVKAHGVTDEEWNYFLKYL